MQELPIHTVGTDEEVTNGVAPGIDEGAGIDAAWDATMRNRQLAALGRHLHSAAARARGAHRGKLAEVEARQDATTVRLLAKACGACGLQEICELAYDATAWKSMHPDTDKVHRLHGQETTIGLRYRLSQDPQASCVAPE
jgi:hypothetical protein